MIVWPSPLSWGKRSMAKWVRKGYLQIKPPDLLHCYPYEVKGFVQCFHCTKERFKCLLFRHTGLSLSSSLNHKSASVGWAAWRTKAGGCWGRGARQMKVQGEHLWLLPTAEEKRGTGKWMEHLGRVMVGSTVWNPARSGRGMGRNMASQWNQLWVVPEVQREGNSDKHCHSGCSVCFSGHPQTCRC